MFAVFLFNVILGTSIATSSNAKLLKGMPNFVL